MQVSCINCPSGHSYLKPKDSVYVDGLALDLVIVVTQSFLSLFVPFRLVDIENSLVGVPSLYRHHLLGIRRLHVRN